LLRKLLFFTPMATTNFITSADTDYAIQSLNEFGETPEAALTPWTDHVLTVSSNVGTNFYSLGFVGAIMPAAEFAVISPDWVFTRIAAPPALAQNADAAAQQQFHNERQRHLQSKTLERNFVNKLFSALSNTVKLQLTNGIIAQTFSMTITEFFFAMRANFSGNADLQIATARQELKQPYFDNVKDPMRTYLTGLQRNFATLARLGVPVMDSDKIQTATDGIVQGTQNTHKFAIDTYYIAHSVPRLRRFADFMEAMYVSHNTAGSRLTTATAGYQTTAAVSVMAPTFTLADVEALLNRRLGPAANAIAPTPPRNTAQRPVHPQAPAYCWLHGYNFTHGPGSRSGARCNGGPRRLQLTAAQHAARSPTDVEGGSRSGQHRVTA
jgi:hypothetical protein